MVSPNPCQGSPILVTVTILIISLIPSLSTSFPSSSPCSSYLYCFSPPPPPPCCHPHLHNSISSPAPSSIFFLVIFTPIFYLSVLYWYHPLPPLRSHRILIVFAFLVIFIILIILVLLIPLILTLIQSVSLSSCSSSSFPL